MDGLGLSIPEIAVRAAGGGGAGSITIAENIASGTEVGTLSVSGGTGSYTFSFAVGGNPGSKFSITGNVLSTAGTLDATPSYALVIQATNGTETLAFDLTVNVAIAPTVSSVAFTSSGSHGSSDTYIAGETIQLAVGFSKAVLVFGGNTGSQSSDDFPQLTISVGGSNKIAAYLSGSGTAALAFAYTVQSGDADANGVSIAANSLALNNSLIQDSVGNSAVLTHSLVSDQANQKVDAVAPTISSVALTSSAGADNTYIAGDVVQGTVTFNDNVVVTGTPQLTLNVGGSHKAANYASGSGGTAIVFSYTVQPGDTDANGISIDANSLALNSGTIEDAVGNNATLTHSAVSDNASAKVDTTAPTISSFNPADGATGVTLSSALQATFGESIAFNSSVSIQLKKSSDDSTVQAFTHADVGGALTISGAVLSIQPSSPLTALTGYYILIGSASITDVGGNFFAGIAASATWAFTSGSSFTSRQFVDLGGFVATSGVRQWTSDGGFISES